MGWNTLTLSKEHHLIGDVTPTNEFYFVHSYHMNCDNKADILATTTYGYDFVSAVQKGNIMGVQFHPEKSHECGMRMLKSFTEM